MEAAGARPAVGAAEDGAGAVGVAHATQLGAEQVERLVPGQRHELVAAAAAVGPGPAVEPAAADHRLRDAGTMTQGAGEILDDAVGIGIFRMRADFEPALRPARREHPPMRRMRPERGVRFGRGPVDHVAHLGPFILRLAPGGGFLRAIPDCAMAASDRTQSVACPSYCGRSSVIVNQGALEPIKMCWEGRIAGASTRLPRATWTQAPSRTTE